MFVQSVQDKGIYADGGGRNLRVEDSGTKYWFQRITIDGKRRNLGLGGYPTVTLAEAHKAALVNVRIIREGRDPLAEKRETSAARQKPPGIAFAYPQQLGGLGHRELVFQNDVEHLGSGLFLLIKCQVLHGLTFSLTS